MSSRIFARTLMSSIETGSSATSRTRVEDDRPRDHRSLLLSSREIRRVLVHELLGGRQSDGLESLRDTASKLVAATRSVDLEGVADRLLDRHRRIERRVRILEDDLHATPQRGGAHARPCCVISRPSNITLPSVAGTSPSSVRPSVVFPLPDSPTRPSTSPLRRSSDTSSTALTLPGLPPEQPLAKLPRIG